jgi:hypothetical protein
MPIDLGIKKNLKFDGRGWERLYKSMHFAKTTRDSTPIIQRNKVYPVIGSNIISYVVKFKLLIIYDVSSLMNGGLMSGATESYIT